MRTSKGFTLMELIVSISVIMILTTAGLGSFISAQKKARDGVRKSDLEQIQKALGLYANDFGVYPSSSAGLILGCGNGTAVCNWGEAFSATVNGATVTYMNRLPKEERADYSYNYWYNSTTKTAYIFSILENENDPACRDDLTSNCGAKKCNLRLSSTGVDMPTGTGACSLD